MDIYMSDGESITLSNLDDGEQIKFVSTTEYWKIVAEEGVPTCPKTWYIVSDNVSQISLQMTQGEVR